MACVCGHDLWDHWQDEEVIYDEDGNFVDECIIYGACNESDCECIEYDAI